MQDIVDELTFMKPTDIVTFLKTKFPGSIVVVAERKGILTIQIDDESTTIKRY